MLCTNDAQPLVIRSPLALCHISHIAGGEHPPNFTVMGKNLCEACWCWCGRDTQEQKQHLWLAGQLPRSPTVKSPFPSGLGQSMQKKK